MSENNVDTKNASIPGYSTVKEFTNEGYKTLIEATKNANFLPQDSDWNFYNTHQSFRNLMSNQGENILCLINDVLRRQSVQGNIKSRDLEEKIELIIEANDVILERVANNLDELAGIRKNIDIPIEIQTVCAELPVNGSWNRISNAKITTASSTVSSNITNSPNSVRLLTAKNIQRPQKFFKDKIDNSRAPWEPRIKEKPNNWKPLAIYLEQTDNGVGEIFCHPYEHELERFEPDSWQLKAVEDAKLAKSVESTPLEMVESNEQLVKLLETLREEKEIAIDLEHHSYRSYLGFTCLMQISTFDKDFIIDTLELRDELHILNEVFTKPTILKVFHGADNDIHWLQRDFSLYIVNMFDTYQAAKQLAYPHLSLAYLLRRFCHIDVDKRFQLADWRMRPLPQELITYAREDTHYLLYISHMLRNELLQKGVNVLTAVYTLSTQVCSRRYEKPLIHDNSHLELYRRCRKLFDNRQMHALKSLYHWRDSIAREEDESPGFVLPNHMLLQIAELLPREMQGILACCNPIPPLVRANLLEIHRLVLHAREQSLVKPILIEQNRSRGNTQQHHTSKINIDTTLNCPHDLSKAEEFRDDLPTLLDNKNIKSSFYHHHHFYDLENNQALLSVFNREHPQIIKRTDNSNANKMQRLKFLGPYERYKLVTHYAQDQQQQMDENERKEKEKEKERPDDEKTDAKRVALIQEHFQKLASSTVQQLPLEREKQSPVNLGQPVAIKRKRESSPPQQDQEIKTEACNKQKNKKKRNKNKNKQQQRQQKQKQKQENNNRKRKLDDNDRMMGEKKSIKKTHKFETFDYSNVDFKKKFAGGGENTQETRKVSMNFKSKGSKNKKLNNISRNNIRSSSSSNSTLTGRTTNKKKQHHVGW